MAIDDSLLSATAHHVDTRGTGHRATRYHDTVGKHLLRTQQDGTNGEGIVR